MRLGASFCGRSTSQVQGKGKGNNFFQLQNRKLKLDLSHAKALRESMHKVRKFILFAAIASMIPAKFAIAWFLFQFFKGPSEVRRENHPWFIMTSVSQSFINLM